MYTPFDFEVIVTHIYELHAALVGMFQGMPCYGHSTLEGSLMDVYQALRARHARQLCGCVGRKSTVYYGILEVQDFKFKIPRRRPGLPRVPGSLPRVAQGA